MYVIVLSHTHWHICTDIFVIAGFASLVRSCVRCYTSSALRYMGGARTVHSFYPVGVHTHTHTHTHTHAHIRAHKHMHIHTHTCTHTCTHMHAHTCTYLYTHT